MQKHRTSHSGFFTARVFLTLGLCACACSIVAGSLFGFFRAERLTSAPRRTLTFAERVAYQRAIEEVYWRHRIWPKERRDPKRPLDSMISQGQLEKKVESYVRKSQALEAYLQQPISAKQLQAEMDRIAQHTKQPEVLRELFGALGNDPFVIAECLARPMLAERKLATVALVKNSWTAKPKAQERIKVAANDLITHAVEGNCSYQLPAVSNPSGGCIDDTWTATSITNAPTARTVHTAVWTGSEMIVWGGSDGTNVLNTGARYDPTTDNWIATSTVDAPSARSLHTAVWTGSEMIVWGGDDSINLLNTGGRYNPVTDNWTATGTANAPSPRGLQTAVWTGSEMIIWGGGNGAALNTGGRYNPSTDSWTPTTITNAPGARMFHTAIWSGSEMIVWGGSLFAKHDYRSGARYYPSTDSWIATTLINAPVARDSHTAVWTSSEMIVWGGYDQVGNPLNSGGRYNPSSDSWTATSPTNAPNRRGDHTAVWTNSEMIVWGGISFLSPNWTNTGGRYDPTMDSWTATSASNAPSDRYHHSAIWTGSEMIIWGGADTNGNPLNTGGRYCAQPGTTPTPTATPTSTVAPTTTPSSTPTGSPTSTPSGTATASPSPTATATSTPSTTPMPTSTATSTPSATPRVTPTPRPRATPRQRPTPVPRITPAPPPATSTPAATARPTPVPRVTPVPPPPSPRPTLPPRP